MSSPKEGTEVSEEEEDVTATVPDVPGALRARDSETGEEVDEEESDDDAEEESDDDAEEESDDGDDASDGDDDEDAPDGDDEDSSGDDPGERGPIEIRYYGTTDVGLVREHNEDNYVCVDIDEEIRGVPDDEIRVTDVGERGMLLAVCDGMGGAAAGEVASQMAVDTLDEVMKSGDTENDHDLFAHRLVYAIEEAGSRIFGAAKMDRSRRGMGTTATAAGLMDNTLFVGQVGDSRCYVLRDGKLKLITKDQSLVNQLIEAGQLSEEEAEEFEHSNIILQALGTTEEVSVDLTFLELRRGDRIMLCSDGLSGLVHAELIQEVMAEGDDLKAMTHRLIEMANAGGGHDNITCVIAEFDGEGLEPADDAPEPNYMPYPLPALDGRSGSIPAREPTMKTSARKPGSDVKRPAIATHADDPTVPSSGGKLGPVIVLLLLIAIIAAIAYSMRDEEPSEAETATPDTTPVEPEAPPEPVDVRIQSDVVGGELFIDEQNYGPLEDGVPLHLELLPGAYRFEARQDGSVLASATVTIREAVPADVALMLPGGAAETTTPDAGIEEEPDPPTMEEEPATMEAATMAPATMEAATMRSAMGSAMRGSMTAMATTTEMTTTTMTTEATMTTAMETPMEEAPLPTNPF